MGKNQKFKNRLYTFSFYARTHIFYYWRFLTRPAIWEEKNSNEAEM